MSQATTHINDLGQTVTQVPGQPGTVTTGRPERVEIHNPVTVDPFAGIPGAYGDDEDTWREHVHDYTSGSCCGQEAPSWVRRDTPGLLDCDGYGDEPANPASEATYSRTEAAVYLGIIPRAVDRLVTEEILEVCRGYAHDGELRHTRAHLDAYVARGRYCSGILPEGYDHEARVAAGRRIAEQRAL